MFPKDSAHRFRRSVRIPVCAVQVYVITISGDLHSGAERWSKQKASALGRNEFPLRVLRNVQWVRFGDVVIGVQLHLRCLNISKVTIHLCLVDVTQDQKDTSRPLD